jgi:hypothetical protein
MIREGIEVGISTKILDESLFWSIHFVPSPQLFKRLGSFSTSSLPFINHLEFFNIRPTTPVSSLIERFWPIRLTFFNFSAQPSITGALQSGRNNNTRRDHVGAGRDQSL